MCVSVKRKQGAMEETTQYRRENGNEEEDEMEIKTNSVIETLQGRRTTWGILALDH